MLKLLVIAALFGAVLCFPKPGFEYEKSDQHEGPLGMKTKDFNKNLFAQKLLSVKRLLPGLSVRTVGKLEKDNEDGTQDVSSFSRASADWLGIDLFGDFLYLEKSKTERLGVGAGLGDLVKVYYNVDLTNLDKGFNLTWDAGF